MTLKAISSDLGTQAAGLDQIQPAPPPVTPPGASIVVVTPPAGMGGSPDHVPVPAATMVAVKSGEWGDASVWSTGAIPTASDSPYIPSGVAVSCSSGVALNVIVDGTLSLESTCSLSCLTLEAVSGTLNIGSADAPASNVNVSFRDAPLDLTNDPGQYLNGLVCIEGQVNIYGQPKTPWAFCPATKAGDASMTLSSAPTGWQAGDTLAFADTRQTRMLTDNPAFAPQIDLVTITGVSGNSVSFTPLKYPHGACASDPTLLPVVQNLSRSVTFSSANPAGTRAHAIFFHDAQPDLNYARFDNMGRTSGAVLTNSTYWNADGSVAKVGTNQIGRYSCHCHHTCNDVNVTGCSITNGLKWGLVIHGTMDSTFQHNTLYGFSGAGIVTETGKEIRNLIDSNCVVNVKNAGRYDQQGGVVFFADGPNNSDQLMDLAFNGTGIWMRAPQNTVTNNVTACCEFAGIEYDGYGLHGDGPGNTTYSMPTIDCDHYQLFPTLGFGNSQGNIAINCQMGLWMVWPQGEADLSQYVPMPVGFTAWNCYRHGVFPYHLANLELNSPVIRFDPAASMGNACGDNSPAARTSVGVNCSQASYQNCGFTMTGGIIAGANYGILLPQSLSNGKTSPPALIDSTTFANWCNIVDLPTTDGTPRQITIKNPNFQPSGMKASAALICPKSETDIFMAWIGSPVSWFTPASLTLVNGSVSQQVYFSEQVASFVIPTGAQGIPAIPAGVIGQTNQQLVAAGLPPVCGVMAPPDAVVNPPRIIGLVK